MFTNALEFLCTDGQKNQTAGYIMENYILNQQWQYYFIWIEALVRTMFGSHFIWTSLCSVFGMQQWEHPLLLCSTSWHLLCLWTPEGSLLLGHSKGHIQWQEQRQNPDYSGQSWESEDKAVGVSSQCLFLLPPPAVSFIVFSELRIHPDGFSLQPLY